jgi:hypothetical protein
MITASNGERIMGVTDPKTGEFAIAKVVDGKDGRPRSAKIVLMADTKRFKAGTQILLNSSHEIIWHKEDEENE